MVDSHEIDEIKRSLQRHFTPGIVVVVGSGLSCAEGLPGMGMLADQLALADPRSARPPVDEAQWGALVAEIRAKGLEPALKVSRIPAEIAAFLKTETAKCIFSAERAVIREVLTGGRVLRFSKLLPHLPNSQRFVVVTTNYDRLIELSAESVGFLVDVRARGSYYGQFSKTAGAFAFAKTVMPMRGGLRKIEERCFSLYKPHGSLDWIESGGQSIRSAFYLGHEHALIITPGRDKYRAGYDQPFDMHRELANVAIDRASKLLIIGYGFNDDHLETHLSARIRGGVPSVVIARQLTRNALAFLSVGPSVTALEANLVSPFGTIVHMGTSQIVVPGENLWDIDGFVRGVMEQ